MLRDFLSNRWVIAGIVIFVLITTGTQLYSWCIRFINEREVERTKQTVQHLINQRETHTEQVDITDITDLGSMNPSNTLHEGGMARMPDSPYMSAEAEVLQPLPNVEADSLLSNVEEDQVPTDPAETDSMKVLADWLDDLNSRLYAKYPEIMELPTLSPAEVANRYKTQEDWNRIRQLSQQMLDEFLDEARLFVSSLPKDVYERVLDDLHKQLTENMGQVGADAAISKLREVVE